MEEEDDSAKGALLFMLLRLVARTTCHLHKAKSSFRNSANDGDGTTGICIECDLPSIVPCLKKRTRLRRRRRASMGKGFVRKSPSWSSVQWVELRFLPVPRKIGSDGASHSNA